MTDIYIVITEDRHADTEVAPFTDQAAAIAHAGQQVEDCARHPEDIAMEDRGLNAAMIADGWVWYCRYSGEGDSVRVVRRDLRGT